MDEESKKLIQSDKKMSPRERGRLLQERLEELDKEGVLQLVKTRENLLYYMGYPKEDYAAGASWITRMIRRNVLTETLTKVDQYGNPEFEYHFLGYNCDLKKKEVSEVVTEVKKMSAEISQPKQDDICNIEMTKGDCKMKIQLTFEQMSKFVSSMMA